MVSSQSSWKQRSLENDWMFVGQPLHRIVASVDGSLHYWRCKTRNVNKIKEGRCLSEKIFGSRGPNVQEIVKQHTKGYDRPFSPMGPLIPLEMCLLNDLPTTFISTYLLSCWTFCSIHVIATFSENFVPTMS